MLKKYFFPLLLAILFLQNCSTARKVTRSASFNYQNLFQKQYYEGEGGKIQLTLEKGETYSGTISPDSSYLVFSSNKSGNFDLFLRPLNDIISIPILRSSPNQTEPAFSPDGKYLVFIDDELDPDGDIVLIKIDPYRILKTFQVSGQQAVDTLYAGKKVYLTNKPENMSRSRESDPQWSPDGKFIVYTSNRQSAVSDRFGPVFGTPANIWIMPVDSPEQARQLTTDGGRMPSFSPDGQKVIYIKNEPGSFISHIFEIPVNGGTPRQITTSNSIDIYPSFSGDGQKIYFTRIFSDTNDDRKLDYKDSGKIMVLPDSKKIEEKQNLPISLTQKNENIFQTRFVKFLGGSVMFARKDNDNINLMIVPGSGETPLRKKSMKQLFYTLEKIQKIESTDTKQNLLRQIDLISSTDGLADLASELKDIELLKSSLNFQKPDLIEYLEKKSKPGHPLLKYLLDLYLLDNKEETPLNYAFEIAAGSSSEYLEHLYTNPGQVYEKLKNKKPVYIDSAMGVLFKKYAAILNKYGKVKSARNVYKGILKNLPRNDGNPEILYQLGKTSPGTDIPEEFLTILSPQKFPLKFPEEIPDFSLTNGSGTKDEKKENQSVQAFEIDNETRFKVERECYDYFMGLFRKNQLQQIQSARNKYNGTDFPLLSGIFILAESEIIYEQKNYKGSIAKLDEINAEAINNTYWNMQRNILSGLNFEKTGQPEKAYASYAAALIKYSPLYNYPELNSLTAKVLSYYQKLVEVHKKNNQHQQVWLDYLKMVSIIIHMESIGAAEEVTSQSAMKIFIGLDEYALEIADTGSTNLEHILKFYTSFIEKAKQNSIQSVIFGRAYLYAMLGIKLHENFEKTNTLNKVNKETVLGYFYTAEEDFEWSIYANPSFADAYIMQGWMYQYIDEKRDSEVHSGKLDERTETDKKLFRQLYEKYFPGYLFEKNIELYQKSLAFLKNKMTPQIFQSFHLNLANNYFLLNNYPKAAESYSQIQITGKNKYRFENPIQEAQYYFHSGKTYFFYGNYIEAAKALEKTLGFYPLSVKTGRKQRIAQRRTILKYLALNYSEGGKYLKSVDYYKEIINEAKKYKDNVNLSMIYLETSRNLLAHMKFSSDLQYIKEAIHYTFLAEREIKNHPESLPPEFIWYAKWFNLSIPVKKWKADDSFKSGENRLAYALPTINQYQYLYSIQADLYKLQGNLQKGIASNNNLIRYASKDDSRHGNETLLSAYFRLGELYYLKKDFEAAKGVYSTAKNIAIKQNRMKQYYIAEKNLMTLACEDIEKASTKAEKANLAEKSLIELNQFKLNYIRLKTEEADKQQKEKNPNIKLTFSERARIEKSAILDIKNILIYDGVFETYILLNQADAGQNTSGDFKAFYTNRKQYYDKLQKTLKELDGIIAIRNEKVPILDRRKNRKMAMVLDMNKALLLASSGNKKEAVRLYSDIRNRAYEFRAYELYIDSTYRYYQLIRNTEPDNAFKALRNIDNVFKTHSYLIPEFADIYKDISTSIIETNLKNRQYLNTVYTENYNRLFELKSTLDFFMENAPETLQSELNNYKDIETIEKILSADIESLRINREPTGGLERILQQLQDRKSKIKNSLLGNPDLASYAYVLFEDILTLNDIQKFNESFIYIIKAEENTHAIYKGPDNKLDYTSFRLNTEELSDTDDIRNNEQTSAELRRFIKWLKTKSPDIIFPSRELGLFPFSEVLNYQVPVEYTMQSAIRFLKNQSLSASNWIRPEKYETLSTGDESYQFIEVSNPDEIINKNYNAFDYEVTDKDMRAGKSLLKSALFQGNIPAVSFISYNLTDKSRQFELISAINLLFAARGSSIVIHNTKSRNESAELFSKTLSGEIPENTKVLISGNSAITGKYFNREKNNNQEELLNVYKEEFKGCKKRTGSLIENERYTEALALTENCGLIYSNLRLKEAAYSGEIADNSTLPDIEQYRQKLEILSYQSITHEGITGYFNEIKNLTDDRKLLDPYTFFYAKALLSANRIEEAGKVLNDLKPELDQDKADEIIESYFYGSLYAGKIQALSQNNELPSEISEFLKTQGNEIPQMPDLINEKIHYFTEKTKNPGKWAEVLLANGAFDSINNSLAESLSGKFSWNTVSLSAYYKFSDDKKFDYKTRTFLSLINQPFENKNFLNTSDSDLYNKSDQRAAAVLSSLAGNNYETLVDTLDALINEKDKDYNEQFNIFLVSYILDKIDPGKLNSDMAASILEKLSQIAPDINNGNQQQVLFSKISKSLPEIFNNPQGQAIVFSEAVSYLNKKLILDIKKIALLKKPDFFADINSFFPEVTDEELDRNITFLNEYKENPDPAKLSLNQRNLILQYKISKGDIKETLETYLESEHNIKFTGFDSPRTVSGFFSTTLEQYFHWEWNSGKITIDSVNKNEITTLVNKNGGDVYYLPLNNTEIYDLLISPKSNAKYFTTTISNNPLLTSPENGKYTWNPGEKLEETPGYSILKMYGGSEISGTAFFGINSGSMSRNSLIEYVVKPVELKSDINTSPDITYSIAYTRNSAMNLYLILIKNFTIEYGKTGGHPLNVFDKVFKELEKSFGQSSDLDYIYILQR